MMVCYVFASPRVKTKREIRYNKNGIDFHAMRRFHKKKADRNLICRSAAVSKRNYYYITTKFTWQLSPFSFDS